jgi:peptidoglycan/LPS O-acetylase OafA/YrhL
MGVDLFFVLSGYLIASQLLRPYLSGDRPHLMDFYRKRLYRVLPAYLAVLALYFLVPAWREARSLPPLWQFLTFTQNLFVDTQSVRAFSQVWSLCIEEHFYLLLPLVVLLMMRKPSLRNTLAVLAGLVLLGICLRSLILFLELKPLAKSGQFIGGAYIVHIYYPTYSRLDGLLTGVAIALVRAFRPAWWSVLTQRGHMLFYCGLGLVGLSIYLFKDRWQSVTGASACGVIIGFPLLSLGLGLLVASALSTNGLLRFRIPGAKLIATLAYSLYLTHKELIHLVDRLSLAIGQTEQFQWLGLYAACCLVAATMLCLCVERPFLIFRDRGLITRRDGNVNLSSGL